MDFLDLDLSDIRLKSSPLFDLFMLFGWFKNGQVGLARVQQAADGALSELEALRVAYGSSPCDECRALVRVVDEVESGIHDFKMRLNSETNPANLDGVLFQLTFLEERLLALRGEAENAVRQEGVPYSSEDELLELVEATDDEDADLLAPNYVTIESSCKALLEGEISREAFLAVLEELRKRILHSRSLYQATYVEPAEWTMESALGDALLEEGMDAWLQALDGLQACASSGSPEDMASWLDLAFQANGRLYLVRRLKKFVDRVCQRP